MLSVCIIAIVPLALAGSAAAGLSGDTVAHDQPTWSPVYDTDFPDPAIMVDHGVAYAFSTQVGLTTVPWATSTDLIHWTPGTGSALLNLPSWSTWGYTWAPSVHANDAGQFVMWYTTRDTALGTQCLSYAESSSPSGPYVDSSSGPAICQSAIGGSIDPMVFVAPDGQAYLYWKNDGNSIGEATGLWAVPLASDLTTVTGTAIRLLAADQDWQGGLIENPNMLYANHLYYLFYSGNLYDGPASGIGYATCVGPVGPCADAAFNPILGSRFGMSSPNGFSVFQWTDGLAHLAFGAWPGAVGYSNGGIRAMYMASLSFGALGVPGVEPANAVLSQGYRLVGSDGGVFSFGDAGFFGSMGERDLNASVVGMADTPDGHGYWLVASDGGVFSFGDAGFFGSAGSRDLHVPIVGIAPTLDGNGYWEVAADGGIFAFGDAKFRGSMGGASLNKPIVGIEATPDGNGYWEVAADGGIFAFGDAKFRGSMGGASLTKPIVGIEPTPDGNGYWEVASDGGIFAFGDAEFFGSMGGRALNEQVVGMAVTADGLGYWLDASDGGVFSFGDAEFHGSTGGEALTKPVVGMAGR